MLGTDQYKVQENDQILQAFNTVNIRHIYLESSQNPMQKKFSTQSLKPQLQVFSQMMRMKFKPQSNAPTTAIVQKNKQIIQKSKLNPQTELSRGTVSRMTNRDKKLKYLNSLSPEYFLVGNQNQIDMIGILGIAHSFVDTDYCWSLSIPTGIDSMAVEPRKSLIAIVSGNRLIFFKYNLKKSKQKPQIAKEFEIKPDVKYIQFPKESLLGLFYEKEFQIYNVEEQKKIYKKCLKAYNEPKSFSLFAVPQTIENSLKVFFIEQDQNSNTFGLWFLKINIEFATIDIEKPQKVYDIKKNLKKQIVIENFSKDIIFMNIDTEILAAKNGYILDSANVSIQSGNAKLRYISNQRLIHISDTKVEIYKMSILTNVVPNKIQITPIDALEINDKPYEAQFFGIISTLGESFAVFYQNISHFNVFTRGEATYWFMLTEAMAMQQKIRQIFNYGSQITKLKPELLEEKCDMARKMGLNEKELYLELWNRSNKNSIEDYQFILATRNYKTIHMEIEKKLKKESMSFRELLKIEESCMIILKQKVYGPNCNEQNIQEYLTSHCFIKKLKLFKDIELYKRKQKRSIITLGFEQEQNNKLLINIQQYYEFKDFDLKGYLVEKIVDFCVYDKESKIVEIRMMLRSFKFIYRVTYKEILEEIIKLCKVKLIVLLKHIPELLPYAAKTQAELQAYEEVSLYDGIWNSIKDEEWQRNLYVDNISTIDNRTVVGDFIKNIWYRRFWLTAHELINLRKEQILQINTENNSELTFYYFISKIFDLIPDQDNQYQVIYFLEETYPMIPQHLRGKIFLHVNLHKFYADNYKKANLKPLRLDEFLKYNDPELFAYFFQQEKHTKNCILKSIKKIYEQTCEEGEGLILFNQGLLAYFMSSKSQISDLKYLLNRMNNQKTEFHQANLSIYEVLIRAMQYKLALGTDQDIPIDQVLIYIQNIPIYQGNKLMEELEIVGRINEQAERFKKMKLNMTIKEIIDNFEDVVARVVQHEFEINRIKHLANQEEITAKTYKILAEVQAVKQKIYGDQHNPGLPFFIYLTKLLEEINLIKFAKNLLNDPIIKKYCPVDITMTENLVVYMYKWALNKEPAFIKNADYIKQLMTLLDEDNEIRRFIEHETAFAIALSTNESPLLYPISDHQYPGLFQLADVLKQLPIQHIIQVDITYIHNCMKNMQDITVQASYTEDQMSFIKVDKITLHQVTSVFILKIIQENHLNNAIPVIKQVLQYDIPNPRYNMIFFGLLIQKLSPELNDQSKNVLIKVISYCFDEPQIIFDFIEYYFHSEETPLMKGVNLRKKLDVYIAGKHNFSKNNFLFSAETKASLVNSQTQQKFRTIAKENSKNLRSTKVEFQTIEFDIISTLIYNEPYLAAKFIQANEHQLNFKTLRAYLSYFVGNPIFDERIFIDYCKRIFSMILESNIKRTDISRIIFHEHKFHFNYSEIKQIGIEDDIDKKLQKTYRNFEKKKHSLIQLYQKKSSEKQLSDNQKIQLLIPEEISSHTPSEYPFSDSDDDIVEVQPMVSSKAGVKKRSNQLQTSFNSKDERAKLMGRKSSVFGEKSSCTLAKSRDSSFDPNQSQEISSKPNVTKSLSLKVPDVKPAVKIYVKKSLTRDVSAGMAKNSISVISQKEESLLTANKNKKGQKLDKLDQLQKKESLVFGGDIENSKMSKQESQYSMNEISEVQEEDAVYRIKELLVQNYDVIGDKIDFEPLVKQQTQEEFAGYLKEVVVKIYTDKALDNKQKLKLIRLTCQKYTKIPINPTYLTVYENIQKIEEKYMLNLPIDRLMPVEGLFIQSKTLDDLFKLILPNTIEISTDQNIYKLSKLISLGFRKNIYEAEISFEYIKKMINQFAEGHSEVELNIRLEIIKSLLSKISIMVLKEKALKLIDGIFANPGLIKQIKNAVVESVKKRGDNNAANDIKKLMQK